jgi:N-acetylglucosaminyldiphosphoundecaprenol N-acetyl-beta-D-mannosaminyltransferase
MTANSRSTRDNTARVVSLWVNVVEMNRLIKQLCDLRERGQGGYVCFSTVHMVMESQDRPDFGERVNGADIVIPDGMPLVWMQKLQGRNDAHRVRANDLMMHLMKYAADNGLKVGFYGGKPAVIDAIKDRAAAELPNLQIVYAYSPPFRPLTEAEDDQIVDEINRTDPDFLFMGLGCPKQETWMSNHRDRLKAIMLGVGASFDFYAGNVKESPEWLGKLGLEWLYRLTQEPNRLWRRYLILNPRFMLLAAKQLLQKSEPPA